MAPTLPVYLSVEQVARYLPQGLSPRQVRDTLGGEGVTRLLATRPGRKARRLVVVADLLRERMPEVYSRLFQELLD